MNAGVALVRAYLRLNGYLTVDEFPVIRGGKGGLYQEITDVDLMGVRFPRAVHVVPGAQGSADGDLLLESDPTWSPWSDGVDVIIAEVKEGRPRLNEAMRTRDVLFAALSRIGCVPANSMDRVVADLGTRGEARIEESEGAPARIRLVAFGSGKSGRREGYTVMSLENVAAFVRTHLERYHEVLNPAELEDPVLGLLHLLRKIS